MTKNIEEIKYANYLGQKYNGLGDECSEKLNKYNHIIQFKRLPSGLHVIAKEVYCGQFFSNMHNGEVYVVSAYGIASISNGSLLWSLNDLEDIEKFLNFNSLVSEKYEIKKQPELTKEEEDEIKRIKYKLSL